MKNINDRINESLNEGRGNWTFVPKFNSMGGGQPLQVGDAKWLQISTEGCLITPFTERDLDALEEDYTDDPKSADIMMTKIRKLKIGESYDVDGGITIYIRIAK